MTPRAPRLWTVAIVGAAATAFGGVPAYADRALALSFDDKPAYGRIVARWADGEEKAPKVSASVVNQVLVLSFDEKITLDFEALKEGLPDWAAVTRMDPDGRTARIGLKRAARAHVSTSVDLLAIDLVPEADASDPPDIVSPLVAKRAAETEAKRIAAIPPPPAILDLEVRGSHAGDSSRVAFYWPRRVGYSVVSSNGATLKLLFANRAKADLAYLKISPPTNLASFDAENTDRGYLVTLTAKDDLPIRHFMEGDVAVVDISRPPPPAPESEAAPRSPSNQPQAAKPPARSQPEPTPQLVATSPRITPPRAGPAEGQPGRLVPPPQTADTQSEDAVPADGAPAVVGGLARETAMAPSWRDGAPKSGVVEVRVAPLSSGAEFKMAFAEPTPAAVFARGSTVWAVFAANADLRLDPATLPAGFKARAQRSRDATMLRIEAPKGMSPSADAEDETWTIRVSPSAMRPARYLRPDRKSGGGSARIETMLVGASGIVWFDDPVIGDQMAAVVAYAPSSASPTARDFVEANLPATAHGLVVIPRSDDVAVTLEGERVVVSMNAAEISDVDRPPGEQVAGEGAAAFVDFAAWGGRVGEAHQKRRSELETLASRLEPASTEGAEAQLDLARFFLGHDMSFEAIGVLKLAGEARPELQQDARYAGLLGAANVLAGRYAEAETWLSKGMLRGDASAALWRGLVAIQRGQWERASELFRTAGRELYAYSPKQAARFSVAWAEAALNLNDFDTARHQAEQARTNGEGETAQRAELVLANLTAIIDGGAAAYPEFERLARQAIEPVAVRAELRRLAIAVESGKLSVNDAAAELESLRFRWRGDDVEMATVGILADQYMRVGRFREALLLAQSTALRDADAPGARDLRIKLTDYFRRLYLDGEADRLDPIQAVGLFYEFSTLAPIGPDGDQMIRKLAQRLVAFDLLDPAAQLLQHQVDNRMRGVGKAVIAIDLARIYLMDKRPDRALAAINSTRQPSLPQEIALERRLLEAAAYLEMGRHDHAVELVQPLEGPEARSLLAEAYWRDRKWAEAAQTYRAMLPDPGAASGADTGVAFKGAIAARMARDAALIGEFRRFAPVFAGQADKASFDLITAQGEASGASLSEAVRRLADAPRVDAFAAAMRQKLAAPATAQAASPANAGGAR